MKSEPRDHSSEDLFPEPMLWGVVEVAHFAILFLSVFLGAFAMGVIWKGLAVWRVLTLAWILPFDEPWRVRLGVWGRSLVYGIPFWLSALLFPLQRGQAQAVGEAAGLYLGLAFLVLLLSGLRSNWPAALVTAVTCGWFTWYQPDLWSGIAGGLLALGTLFLKQGETAARAGERRVAGMGLAACWSLFLVWNVLFASDSVLVQSLAAWFVLSALSAEVMLRARSSAVARPHEREVELALPGLSRALGHRYGVEMRRRVLPWLGLLVTALWGPETAWLGLLVAVSLFGLRHMLAREYVQSLHWQWWCCGLFVLFWGAAESAGPSRFGWLAVGLLTAAGVALGGSTEADWSAAFAQPGVGVLEAGLRTLRVKAPEGLIKEILAQSEPSVDIDNSLQSMAPKGFRERLMERLKRADGESESESEDQVS